MIQTTKLLARVCCSIAIVSLVYFAPMVWATELPTRQIPQSNNKNMSEINERSLEVSTINFLNAIEDARINYEAKNTATHEELEVRADLRNAFEEYFSVLMQLETKEGLEITERSREVIQSAIEDFMESDSKLSRISEIALDLDAYSKVMTESLIHSAVSVK